LRLVACPSCHVQFDVSGAVGRKFRCACGETIESRELAPVEASIKRCGACGAGLDADVTDCAYCGSAVVRDPGALSLICPECYARNALASRFCTGCGVAFRPRPLPDDGGAGAADERPALSCPCCAFPLDDRAIADLAVHECRQCNGLFVAGERLEALVARAVEAARSASAALGGLRAAGGPRKTRGTPTARKVEYRRCPVCRAQMHRRNFEKTSGVITDRCVDHGTWLDRDELEEIAGFILAGGMDRPLPSSLADPAGAPDADARAAAHFVRILAEQGTRRENAASLGGVLRELLESVLD
jgi:Zn-finger nucleic acid-binding protein/ribosomal protein L40E